MNETITIAPQEKEIFIARELVGKYIRRCQEAIRLAVELDRGKVTKEVMSVPGMSAAKNRLMINRLVGHEDTKYLEVGTHVGAMFCAALHGNNPAYACGIDNFSQFEFGPDGEERLDATKQLEAMFKENCKKHIDCNFDFFNRDCFDLTKTQKDKLRKQRINTYLYDGPHSQVDHIRAITDYLEFLDNVFIVVIDDWNIPEVRNGTFKALKSQNVKVWWQINLEADIANRDIRNWWNGVWVAVCEKRNKD